MSNEGSTSYFTYDSWVGFHLNQVVHTHINIYIYIYVYVCLCVYVLHIHIGIHIQTVHTQINKISLIPPPYFYLILILCWVLFHGSKLLNLRRVLNIAWRWLKYQSLYWNKINIKIMTPTATFCVFYLPRTKEALTEIINYIYRKEWCQSSGEGRIF